jgi:hypothetical protein
MGGTPVAPGDTRVGVHMMFMSWTVPEALRPYLP